MAFRALWLNILGYVIIKIQGKDPERFLNTAVKQRLRLWNVEKVRPDFLVAKTTVRDFRLVRQSCRQSGVRVHVLERGGLPFSLKRLWSRYVFVFGGLTFLVLLCYLSTFVWFVEVEGNNHLDKREILRVLEEEGLKPGTPRNELETGKLARSLVNRLPRLAWAGVELRGTLAHVNLVEKSFSDEALIIPGDIVAAQDGLVVNITPFTGDPLIKPGDTVRRGQPLITGEIGRWHPEYHRLQDQGRPPYLRADGIIEARVWYEEVVEIPFKQVIFEKTGKQFVDYEVYLHKWAWSRSREDIFSHYYEGRQINQLPGIGNHLPFEWHQIIYEELKPRDIQITREQALQKAKETAKNNLNKRLPNLSVILKEEISVSEDNVKVQVRLVVETRENIREFRPIPRQTWGGSRN